MEAASLIPHSLPLPEVEAETDVVESWNPLRPNRRPALQRQRLLSGWIQSACRESVFFCRNVSVRSKPPRFRICFSDSVGPFCPQLPPVLLKVSYRCGTPDVMDVFFFKRIFFPLGSAI
jgi:hypothetical protein